MERRYYKGLCRVSYEEEVNKIITVLLPVYNGEQFLADTIKSILAQTCTDFELLIVDDGSTDGSLQIMRSFYDERIRILQNPQRLKLSGALNRGMKEAGGKYIARMDADDIALPMRLEKQLAFMERHPEVGMCGTGIEIFGDVPVRKDIYPDTSEKIKAYTLFDCAFCHPTVMMRRDLFLENDLWYDGTYYPTEDYELWSRAINFFPTVNISDVLLRYRVHGNSMTGSDWDAMDKQAARIIRRLLDTLGVDWTEDDLALHRNIGRGRSCRCRFAEIELADTWLQTLAQQNNKRKEYDADALSYMLALVWYRLCFNNSFQGMKVLRKYMGGGVVKGDSEKLKRSVLLLLSIVKNKLFSSRTT